MVSGIEVGETVPVTLWCPISWKSLDRLSRVGTLFGRVGGQTCRRRKRKPVKRDPLTRRPTEDLIIKSSIST